MLLALLPSLNNVIGILGMKNRWRSAVSPPQNTSDFQKETAHLSKKLVFPFITAGVEEHSAESGLPVQASRCQPAGESVNG